MHQKFKEEFAERPKFCRKLLFFNDDYAIRTDFKHFKAAIYNLEQENLGKVVNKKKYSSRQRSELFFMKVSLPKDDASLLKYVDNLLKYKVDLDACITFDAPTIVDAPITSKRCLTDSEDDTISLKKSEFSEV